MFRRCVGFVLLMRFAGLLQAVPQSCSLPDLNQGYFVLVKETNLREAMLTYACEEGHKPVAKGWWTTVICQMGKWSPEPQCISENACLPPTVANGDYIINSKGWYEENDVISIRCNNGYEHKESSTAQCLKGVWSPLPSCQERRTSCKEPPKIPNAVIMQKNDKVFAADSSVEYKCQSGHTTAPVTCRNGKWSEPPTCSLPDAPTRPVRPLIPGLPDASTRPALPVIPGNRCDGKPYVTNGEIVETGSDYLKYECALYYKLEGSDTVRCLSDGSWTPVPSCREAFCYVNTEDYPFLISDGTQLLGEGDKKRFKCLETSQYSEFQCISNGIVKHTDCLPDAPTRPVRPVIPGSPSLDSQNQPAMIQVQFCGERPSIINWEVVEENPMWLKYLCQTSVHMFGFVTVVCFSGSGWSELPICKAEFCRVPQRVPGFMLTTNPKEFLPIGQEKAFRCFPIYGGKAVTYGVMQCTETELRFSGCIHDL